MDRGEGSTELETPENGLQPSRQEPESLKERSTSVSSFSTVDDSSLTISGSVAGADSVSDYASIGVDESFRSVGARRRLVRKENEELRRDILTSLKVDIAAGSAKLFVTNRLLKRSIGNTNETLGQLEMGRNNVAKLEEICKSLSFFGRQVLPDWQLK